jgi:uncharacterized protein YjaZ
MPCALHVLNADGGLTAWLPRIQRAFASSLSLVSSRIPVGDVDVIVYEDAINVVPELGMSGFCTSPRRMYLPLDRKNAALPSAFERVFQSFMAHELHHCARRQIKGFASTLGQALVTEGLACCFEEELPGGSTPMYATRVRGTELERVQFLARSKLNEPFSGWDEWFFGEREPEIPPHAGYSLGYLLVSNWLRKRDSTAAIEHAVHAERVLADA